MSEKTSKKEILKIIQDDIIIYLRSGKLSINKYIEDLDLNIDNLEKLLKIHFLLDKDVEKYILELNKNMKKFNTSTTHQETLNIGGIKGNVSWNKTIQARNNINPKDKSIFVCNENIKNYNIKENIVLKTFLEIIYNILKSEEVIKNSKHEWFSNSKQLKTNIENIYLKNIYLSRINLKRIKVDNRMIEDVCKNRNKLYSQAAKLLKYYNKIMSLDEDEIRKMLSSTFIEVAEVSTLFELYWVLKIIKDNTNNKKLYILDDKSNKVAEWEEDNLLYTIYHNSSGSEEISFNVSLDEIKGIDNEFVKKQIKIVEDTNKLVKELFGDIGDRYNSLFNGRPDVLIEVRELATKKLAKIIIGEVKHTTSRDYAIEGLKELIEYINYIKQKISSGYEYMSNVGELDIKGILFLDNIEVNEPTNKGIKVVTINNKESKIELNFK